MFPNSTSNWLALEANSLWERFDDHLEYSSLSCYSGEMGTVCIIRWTLYEDLEDYDPEFITYQGILFPANRNDVYIPIVIHQDGVEDIWNFEVCSIDNPAVMNLSLHAKNIAKTRNWSSPSPLYVEALMRLSMK